MTVSTTDLREEYTASASQTLFTFDFRVFADTDITVYQTASGSAYDDAADIITAYSVSRNANQDSSPGGSITLNSGATAGDRITIVSSVPETRTTDYQTGGSFNPDTVDNDFDRVVTIAKQASAKASRAMLAPESEQNAGSLNLPSSSERANKFLTFDDDGNPVTSVSGLDISGSADSSYDYLYLEGGSFSLTSNIAAGTYVPSVGDVKIVLALS